MCGNFGLLSIGSAPETTNEKKQKEGDGDEASFKQTSSSKDLDILAISLHESLHEVSRLNGLRLSVDSGDSRNNRDPMMSEKAKHDNNSSMLSPLIVLQSQTASTEIRGGQAGGYSSLEYKSTHRAGSAIENRVRMVARKRYALAADLAGRVSVCVRKSVFGCVCVCVRLS